VFEVAMHDSFVVGGFQRVCKLNLLLDHHFNKDLALAAEAKSRSPALRSERRPVNVEEFQHS
jgi:hypothetical protein